MNNEGMNQQTVNGRKEVFVIPPDPSFRPEHREHHILYAPFAASALLLRPEESGLIEAWLSGSGTQDLPGEYQNLLKPVRTVKPVFSPLEYNILSVIAGFNCNFHCSYCYSAGSRSGAEIDPGQLAAAIGHLLDAGRSPSKERSIFITGGGEPLLARRTLFPAIAGARQMAKQHSLNLSVMMMTNGALTDGDIARELIGLGIHPCISFEILEDVQQQQRGHYRQVAEGIDCLLGAGLIPSVSATITPLNAGRQVEMLQQAQRRFPAITDFSFDPVVDNSLFTSVADLEAFYTRYLDGFFEARRFARDNGLHLFCSLMERFDRLTTRYCRGQLCLTPGGSISICHTIAAPSDTGYEACVYGKAENDRLTFDTEKFTRLMSDDLHAHPECNDCFARWNCGGGCLMVRTRLDKASLDAHCNFTREFTRRFLYDNLVMTVPSGINDLLKEPENNIY
jgi:radical SAM protein with 4Fe4S-binding SPASM domain